jgi:hypothetical protein
MSISTKLTKAEEDYLLDLRTAEFYQRKIVMRIYLQVFKDEGYKVAVGEASYSEFSFRSNIFGKQKAKSYCLYIPADMERMEEDCKELENMVEEFFPCAI